MGMDMLDVIFRLERTFRIKIVWKELERFGIARTPPDLLVEDLLAYVRLKWRPRVIADDVIAVDVVCVGCRSSLRGVSPFKYCPKCSELSGYEHQLRLGVRNVLMDALGVESDQVTDEASLVRDLGAG
jgi:acyl carrier protein